MYDILPKDSSSGVRGGRIICPLVDIQEINNEAEIPYYISGLLRSKDASNLEYYSFLTFSVGDSVGKADLDRFNQENKIDGLSMKKRYRILVNKVENIRCKVKMTVLYDKPYFSEYMILPKGDVLKAFSNDLK
ncbi:hypothetical protein GCM10007350_18980 [Jeongeupia chitinilytica]|uniref:Uncharacterized protein n=1 Tax=Jeongeupia chitinilytica TaxID=1041641 RepID=A0ABQ3H005_9NEIS|nr:hypothetical protein GCM10007350_18980 [Jeongeupia chitinilytica]